MSDFTSEFWSLYVIVGTLVSILACGVLLYVTGRKRVRRRQRRRARPPTRPATSGTRTSPSTTTRCRAGGCGSSTSRSCSRSATSSLYPGLGKLPGVLGWTSAGAYATEVDDVDAKVAPLYAKYLAMDVKEVADDPQANAMGERLFLNHCAQCHGSDAGGARAFPNLRDKDWLYGGDPEAIKASITDGRNGIMPPFGAVLGGDGVKNVSSITCAACPD